MSLGLMGEKLGMTSIFTEGGNFVPVTVIEIKPNVITYKKAASGKDGYNSIQLGYGEVKAKALTKPEIGHLEKRGVGNRRHLKEFRVDAATLDAHEVGSELSIDSFKAGDKIDITGTSKGRGFSGVMKRHNFKGKDAGHGTHEAFRHGGSIGTSATPSHVLKGRKMPGQYGNTQVTVQNLQVVDVRPEQNIILVKGAVPGFNGSLVVVKAAVKVKTAKKLK